ncbi:hypothetical protein PSPO01_03502 [Paraphaeosphaeria sporulosa]
MNLVYNTRVPPHTHTPSPQRRGDVHLYGCSLAHCFAPADARAGIGMILMWKKPHESRLGSTGGGEQVGSGRARLHILHLQRRARYREETGQSETRRVQRSQLLSLCLAELRGRKPALPGLNIHNNSAGTGYTHDWLNLSAPVYQPFSVRKLRNIFVNFYPLLGAIPTIQTTLQSGTFILNKLYFFTCSAPSQATGRDTLRSTYADLSACHRQNRLFLPVPPLQRIWDPPPRINNCLCRSRCVNTEGATLQGGNPSQARRPLCVSDASDELMQATSVRRVPSETVTKHCAMRRGRLDGPAQYIPKPNRTYDRCGQAIRIRTRKVRKLGEKRILTARK